MKTYQIILALLFLTLIILFRKRIKRFLNLLRSKYTNFTLDEFDSPDEPGSGKKYMDKNFVRRLDLARDATESTKFPDGIPFVIVKGGGYRTEAYNTKIGGAKFSEHMDGQAADINYTTIEERNEILKSLVKLGFNRFGVRTGASGSSIHVDSDKGKKQYVVWGYEGVSPGVNPFALA